MLLTNTDRLALEATLKKNNTEVTEIFMAAPYSKQVLMYCMALQREYYELLAHLTTLLPDLSEDFLADVDKQLIKLNKQ